jgi:hypothetical protein
VTGRYFGTGNGSRTVWKLAAGTSDRALLHPVLYRKDWQMPGHYQVYSTSRANLLLQSQTLQTSWTRNAVLAFGSGSVVDSVVAPDGTTTAETVTEDNTTAQHYLSQTIVKAAASTAYTLSFYAKKKDRQWIYLQGVDGGNFARCYYNLNTGVIGTASTGGAGFSLNGQTISSVGNGWYRCTLSFTTTATTNLVLYVAMTTADATASYAGDNTSGVYLWGAQLETGSSATSYIPTVAASASVTDYSTDATGKVTFAAAPVLAADVAYLDPWLGTACYKSFGTGDGSATMFSLPWKPVTEQIYKNDWAGNQLLYSTSRTNLLLRSQEFDVTWTPLRTSVPSTNHVAPDGTSTADFIKEDNTTNTHIVYQGIALSAGQAYTVSVYVKAAGRDKFQISFDGIVTDIDLVAVTASGTGTIASVGNGWFRVTIYRSSLVTPASNVYFVLRNAAGATNYLGDNTSGVYLWGAQLETGSSATSYIPTTTAAASVTDYSITPKGDVTFAPAPANGAVLTWTGNMGPAR